MDEFVHPLTGRYASLSMRRLFAPRARIALWRRLWLELMRAALRQCWEGRPGVVHLDVPGKTFDISTLFGADSVGSMVQFVNGKPNKDGYRRFRIRSVAGQDDFAMMKEVVYRRYKRVMEENGEMPDLILIDGGKGQLGAAVEALKELGADLNETDIIGLAKAREKGLKYGGISEARAFERVYQPGDKEPRVLSPTSAAVNLLAQVRDESHRFAITHHRKLRGKSAAYSPLDDIPGIGKKRKMALIKKLGSLRKVKEASLEELTAVPGIPRNVAEAIYQALRQKAAS